MTTEQQASVIDRYATDVWSKGDLDAVGGIFTADVFGFWMHRFEGDRIAEEWATWDTHGFLQQIGVSLA